MGAGRPYIDRCQICGRYLEMWDRRKVTVAKEHPRRMENGKFESQYRAFSHAVICPVCAGKISTYIEKLKEE